MVLQVGTKQHINQNWSYPVVTIGRALVNERADYSNSEHPTTPKASFLAESLSDVFLFSCLHNLQWLLLLARSIAHRLAAVTVRALEKGRHLRLFFGNCPQIQKPAQSQCHLKQSETMYHFGMLCKNRLLEFLWEGSATWILMEFFQRWTLARKTRDFMRCAVQNEGFATEL